MPQHHGGLLRVPEALGLSPVASPFTLVGTAEAIIEQNSDTPGYDETADGALFPYGFGLTYED